MKRLIILTSYFSGKQDARSVRRRRISHLTINYLNLPNLSRGNYKYLMNLQKKLFFITNLYAPYFYYESTGSIGSVGFGYSEVLYGGDD